MTEWAVDPARKGRLAEQLRRLAQRGIDDAFEWRGAPPKRPDLSELVPIVRAMHPEVRDGESVGALQATIKAAVDRLPDVPLRLAVRGRVPPEFTERLLGRRMFNVVQYDYDEQTWRDGEEEFKGTEGKHYDYLINSMFDRFGLGEKVLDRGKRIACLHDLREKLAERLLLMEAKALGRSSAQRLQ